MNPDENGTAPEAEQPKKKRGGRKRGSKIKAPRRDKGAPQVAPGTVVVQSFVQGIYKYEQRYQRCGTGCSVCMNGGVNFDPTRPGHGPYWYRSYKKEGKTFRKYMGKELDLAKAEAEES